jgi:hypothetical protein
MIHHPQRTARNVPSKKRNQGIQTLNQAHLLSYFWRKISIMTSLQKQDLLPIFDKMHDWKLLSNEI